MFVSALRVLSSSRKYTSFCLAFLGVKNTFGNDHDTLWNLTVVFQVNWRIYKVHFGVSTI